jgi:hypothetical protein
VLFEVFVLFLIPEKTGLIPEKTGLIPEKTGLIL